MKTKFLLLSIIFCQLVTAQKSITIVVVDDTKQNVPNASIIVREANSKQIATGITDLQGKLQLTIKNISSYTIEVTHIGYYPFLKKISSNESSLNEIIVLKVDTTRLKDVTVQSNKPLIFMEPDRYVLNIDGKTTIGNTVTDILKKSPGINITNDQVTLEGKSVVLQVNGKTLPLSGKELLSYLSTSSSEGIGKIELITTPPSGMDAGFTGGVINLQMKKLKTAGFTGRVSASLGYRSTYPNESIGGNLNFRKGAVNIFSSLGIYENKQVERMKQLRYFGDQAHSTTINENNNNNSRQRGLYQTTGIDLQLSKRSVIGLLVNTNATSYNNSIVNTSDITNGSSIDSVYTLEQTLQRNGCNSLFNLNLKAGLDSLGQEISVDIDYGIVNSKNNSNQDYGYLLPNGAQYKNRYYVDQFSDNSSKLFGVKTDYHKQLKKTALDAGFKFATSAINYKLGENRRIVGNAVVPIADTFNYHEDIAAVYISLFGKIRNWNFRTGLRAEYTGLSGKSIIEKKDFSSDYISLFPTISLSRQWDKKNSLSLSYRKSISRPRFQQLNPFRYYSSAFYFYSGNPELKPYYPSSLRLGYGYNNKLSFDVSWSFAKDKITEISNLQPGTNITQSIRANNGKYNSIYSGVTHYDNITKWWYSNSTLNLVHNSFEFVSNNTPVKFENTSLSFYSSQRLTLRKTWIVELYGYATSATYYDATYSKPFWYMDLTIYKEIMKGNGQLSFGIRDIFYTSITRTESKYANINTILENRWDSRQVDLSFSYKFGDKNVKANRQRNGTAVSDEKNRAN